MNDALLALADHDEATVRARHAVTHPPSQAAHDEALAGLRALAVEVRELESVRAPLADRAAVLERDAIAARDRATVISQRLATSTGAGRELEAMEEERASLASRASQLEDDQLELLEQLEPLDAAVEGLRARATDLVARRDETERAVAGERASADEALRTLEAARPALEGALDPALRARYDKAAAHLGASGAARLVDGRCGGCRIAVPAAVADRLLHGGDADLVLACDECGRLLVR
ncbi:MAG TPA: C4-type zinc ribbon domain-containing protein [Acidimicrobiales bacterium]